MQDKHGVRHDVVDVLSFRPSRGDTPKGYTNCFTYIPGEVDTDPALIVTCIRCIAASQRMVSILRNQDMPRGMSTDVTIIDEAQDFADLTRGK